jgi:hypothetical protein
MDWVTRVCFLVGADFTLNAIRSKQGSDFFSQECDTRSS